MNIMDKIFCTLKTVPESKHRPNINNLSAADTGSPAEANIHGTSNTDPSNSTAERSLLEKLQRLPHPPQQAPGKPAANKDIKVQEASHIDGQEGQGDAVVQITDLPGSLEKPPCSGADGMTTHVGTRSEEDWIVISPNQTEMEAQNETIGHGCYVVPVTDSSSGSSYLAVTSSSPTFPSEPSPQVSSSSISRSVSSCSCSDDDHDTYVHAARPSRVIDRFDTEGGHGPWVAEDDFVDSPAIPIQHYDYEFREPYSDDDNYLRNGYQSPVSDEDTFFACQENLTRRSDEVLTNATGTFSDNDDSGVNISRADDVACRSKSGQERDGSASHPIQSVDEDFPGYSQRRNQSSSAPDEYAIQEASSELANEVLRMSLNVLDASTPPYNAEAVMLNSNDAGNDESGFYDGGFTPSERPVLSVSRAVNVHIEVEETPEETPSGLNGTPGDSTRDGIRMEILGETPMSGEVSMQLCGDTPQTHLNLQNDSLALGDEKDPGLQMSRQHSQSELRLNQQRELMANVEKERQSMESMLREAQRAHDEFNVLRKTVDKLIERMADV